MSQFKIYSSSAGSGKTYTLTREYLRLLLSQSKPTYFRHVLAITFTNAAAAEMKHRILGDLQAFGHEDFGPQSPEWGKFQEIAEAVRQDTGSDISDEELQLRARRIFYEILQNYTDFGVRTIDSFMKQLANAFSEELELPYNFDTETDTNGILLEAAERLMGHVDTDEPDAKQISKMLKDFALEKADAGKSWGNLAEEIAEFGKQLVNDQYYLLVNQATELTIKDFSAIRRQVIAYTKTLEEKLNELADRGDAFFAEHGLTPDFFSYGNGGIGGIFSKIRKEPFSPFGTRIKNQMTGQGMVSAKVQKSEAAKVSAIQEPFLAICQEIYDFYETHTDTYFLYNSLLPNLPKLALLNKLKEEADSILRERNKVFISEFNRKILQIILSEPVPFIYERIGEKYNHLLIDEFQDTSDLQFFNVLPLIETSLAEDNFNLIVGDAKQSIYRWRGGKMEMLVHLFSKNLGPLLDNPLVEVFQQDQFMSIAPYLKPEALAVNFRSAREIVDFNNELYEGITAKYGQTYPLLAQVYKEVSQQPRPNAPQGGHVEFTFLEEKATQEEYLAQLLAYVHEAEAAGYTWGDIAILLRKNKEAALVANFLVQQGYEVLSQESLLLNSSGAVRLAVSMLKVIDRPDNKLAKYEAAYLFCFYCLSQTPDSQLTQQINSVIESGENAVYYQFFNNFGYELRPESWQRAGVYEMTERMVQSLRLFEKTAETPYLFALLDEALNYGLTESNHVADFLLFWEDQKEKLSIGSPATTKAITVTTVHRSKGLQYPVVILPFATWTLKPTLKSLPWYSLADLPDEQLVHHTENGDMRLAASPMRLSKEKVPSTLRPQYEADLEATFLENLNSLYVATTRPTDRLYIISNKKGAKPTTDPSTINTFFFDLITTRGYEPTSADCVVWHEGGDIRKPTPPDDLPVYELHRIISQPNPDKKLQLRRISEKLFDFETLDKAKDRGNKVHHALALIHSVADIPAALYQLQLEGVVTEKEHAALSTELEQLVSHPRLAAYYAPDTEGYNEQEILMKGQQPARPDRVVFTPAGVSILEFKTGEPRTADEQQLRHYARLYQQMGYAIHELLLIYLEMMEIREVKL